ncbi:MAG: dihydropteroate synthase, partial [Candidatus Delongbacteria bacterium]|nr:dihydropteroate synthase [Candidatus Delongbacteria bacterium]
ICQDYDVFPRPLIIGERTNASGSKKFREALLKNDYDTMTEIALDQEKEGAHLLDLSLVYAGIDEMNAMEETVKRLAKYLRIPLCIDSTNPVVIEVALKNYGGKALINSINLEDGGKKAEKILDLALEYGASVIALTIDEKGMAKTCGRKIEIADRILNLTHSKGIPDGDVFIDFLTFPLGSGDKTLFNAGVETLNAVAEIKKQRPKVRTILGVSNISYGLNEKARRIINSLFLYHSVKYGIDAAIFHAGKVIALNQIQDDIRTICDDLIFNRRTAEYDPLEELIKAFDSVKKEDPSVEKTQLSLEDELVRHIVDGRKKGLKEILDTALEKYSPLEIINNFLLKGMSEVGELFGNGTLQLPFVLKSAEVMKSAADYLSINIDENEIKHKATVILATVKGDVHDIGKNLVDIILSNNGYKVYNLGIDCTPQTIADAALKYKGDYIGLSGLLVSSAIEMKNVAAHLNEKKINIPVFCGGAALNSSFVKDYLAPIYKGRIDFAKDAFGLIKVMKNEAEDIKIINENKPEKNILKQVNITNDYIRPEKPFGGVKHIKGIAFVDIEPFINKKRLFNVRWSEKDNEKALKLFNDCIRQSSTLSFDISYGYFDFPVTGFKFPRRPTEPLLSLEDFLKQDDFIAVFLATVGKNAVEVAGNLFKADSFSDYYHWYGFTAELTEALAEYINSVIRKELSINNSQGKRYSPGYSVWPDLNEQKKICSLLDSESIGVTLTENNQLVPELSVSGIFIYHPDAVYFNSVHSIQKKID